MDGAVLHALALSFFAGASTAIGSALVLFDRATSDRTLASALGFSAGVMIYVSFVELLADASASLTEELGSRGGELAAVGTFFGGIALIALIDRLVPELGNPHELRYAHVGPGEIAAPARGQAKRTGTAAELSASDAATLEKKRKLMRVGVLSALALAIHNFPEGLATFTSALHDPDVGLAVSIAVGIHNVPEGIAVSIPILHATGSRRKAFVLSALSGLAEPAGALIGWLLLGSLLGPLATGILLAGVAGIMVFISLDQLLPAAEEFGEHHLAVYGLVAGMAVMAGSLILLE